MYGVFLDLLQQIQAKKLKYIFLKILNTYAPLIIRRV